MFSIKSLAAGLWVAAAVTVPLAKAQEKPDNYPTRPISFVVAYPAGGGMDVAARTMAGVAEQQLMVSDTERLPFLPDTPAMSELGIDIPARTWGASRFVTVNPETPEDIKAYLASSIYSVLSSDEAKAAFEEVGMTLSPTDRNVTAKNYAASYDALSQFLSGSTE